MKKILALILTMSLVLSICTTAFAQVGVETPQDGVAITVQLQQPSAACMYGQVMKVEDEEIEVKSISDDETVILHISKDTYFIDAIKGTPLEKPLKVGDSIAAYYGPVVTMSMPAQSTAVAIISNIPQDVGFPFYAKVENVEKTEDGIKVTIDGGSKIITLTNDITIEPFKTKNIVTINDVTVGTELVLWYDIMTASIPGFATARKATILSSVNEVDKDKMIVSTELGVVFVNGEEILFADNEILYKKHDTVMVPLRILSEALNYEVNWIADMNAVILNKGAKSATLSIDSTEYGVNKMRLVLETAPEIIENKTYVSVDFFEKALDVEVVINASDV